MAGHQPQINASIVPGVANIVVDQAATQLHENSQPINQFRLHHEIKDWQFDKTAMLDSGDLKVDDVGHKAKLVEIDQAVDLAAPGLEKGERSQNQQGGQQDQRRESSEKSVIDFQFAFDTEKQAATELVFAFRELNEQDVKLMKSLVNNPLDMFKAGTRKLSYVIFPLGLVWDLFSAFRAAPSFAKIERAAKAYAHYHKTLEDNISKRINAALVEEAFQQSNRAAIKNPHDIRSIILDEIRNEAQSMTGVHHGSDLAQIMQSVDTIFGTEYHQGTHRARYCTRRLLDKTSSRARKRLIARVIDRRIEFAIQEITGKENGLAINLVAKLTEKWDRLNPILKSGWINPGQAEAATNQAKTLVRDFQKQLSKSALDSVQASANNFAQGLSSNLGNYSQRVEGLVHSVIDTVLGKASSRASSPA